jgi:hypothetical protein
MIQAVFKELAVDSVFLDHWDHGLHAIDFLGSLRPVGGAAEDLVVAECQRYTVSRL